MITSTTDPGFDPHVTAVTSTARTGMTVVHDTERGTDKHLSLGSQAGAFDATPGPAVGASSLGLIRDHPRVISSVRP